MSSENNNRSGGIGSRSRSDGNNKVSQTTGHTTSLPEGHTTSTSVDCAISPSTQAQRQIQDPGDAGQLDDSRRLIIIPDDNNGFYPSVQATRAVIECVKPFFDDSWIYWGEIPYHVQVQMWTLFMCKCIWYPEYNAQIWSSFQMKVGTWLADTLCTAREKGKKPSWITEAIWAKLNERWASEEYMKKSAQGKVARSSDRDGTLHVQGLVSIGTHQKRMEKEKKRTVTNDEVPEETHLKKKRMVKKSRSSLVPRGHMLSIKEVWSSIVAQPNLQSMMQ